MQSQCTAEVVRILPPTAFWPRPRVESAIVRIVLDPARREAIPDRAIFHDFTRALFCHRRKYLRSELISCFKGRLDKSQVDAVLESLAISPQARAEQLDVPTVLRLCEACNRAIRGAVTQS